MALRKGKNENFQDSAGVITLRTPLTTEENMEGSSGATDCSTASPTASVSPSLSLMSFLEGQRNAIPDFAPTAPRDKLQNKKKKPKSHADAHKKLSI